MKVARFVLKCVALGLCVGAAVCAVIAYWDKISALFCTLREKCKCSCGESTAAEYADYADFEEWAEVQADEAR
jgi:hypothetical protein